MDKYRTISAVCQGAGLLSGYEEKRNRLYSVLLITVEPVLL